MHKSSSDFLQECFWKPQLYLFFCSAADPTECAVNLTNISCLGDWDGKRDCVTHIQILQKTWIQDSHDTNVVPCVRICIILYTWLVSTYIFTCSSVRGCIRGIYWLTGKSCLSVHVSAGLVELQNRGILMRNFPHHWSSLIELRHSAICHAQFWCPVVRVLCHLGGGIYFQN